MACRARAFLLRGDRGVDTPRTGRRRRGSGPGSPLRTAGEGGALPGRIRLIISDAEGCLIPGMGLPWDLEVLRELAAYNRLARGSRELPPLTILSGRPAQYVEALGQALGVFMPAGCENGAVILHPGGGRAEPRYDAAQREMMDAVRRILEEGFARGGRVRIPGGREVCVSLVPEPPPERPEAVAELCREAAAFVEARLGLGPDRLHFTHSAGAVDITPAGIDKGQGLRALADAYGCAPEEILGIGDARNDLPFLEAVGVAAAPANAAAEVRRRVAYVARAALGAGVVEIVARFTGAIPAGGFRGLEGGGADGS